MGGLLLDAVNRSWRVWGWDAHPRCQRGPRRPNPERPRCSGCAFRQAYRASQPGWYSLAAEDLVRSAVLPASARPVNEAFLRT
jgi:hypothetical protein